MRILGRAILFAEVYAIFAAGVVAFAPLQPATAADFTVTTPNNAFVWTINGMGNNPILTLVRGKSYTFAVSSASFHPFEITNAPPGSVTGNNTFSGTVTFNVPADPGDYGYHCS